MAIGDFISGFYGYGSIARNESVVNGESYPWPDDCLSNGQRIHFAKCVFYRLAELNVQAGGILRRWGRVSRLQTFHPQDGGGADGSGGTVLIISPRHRYVHVSSSTSAHGVVESGFIPQAYNWACANWKRPQRFPVV